jgi:hypothetical protein
VFAAVFNILDGRTQRERPLEAAEINQLLPVALRRTDGAIRHHMRQVWSGRRPGDPPIRFDSDD